MNKISLMVALLICSTNVKSATINWNNFFIAHAWVKGTSGVIYFEQDLKDNPQKMCQDLNEENWRLTMIDQESLEISRLKKIVMPSYREKIKEDKFKTILDKASANLSIACLKVNLAPVVDQGQRGYENNSIMNYTNIFAKSMREHNIIPTWKHFPGMSNNKPVYGNYQSWYKNKNGEGVIETQTYSDVLSNAALFKNNNYDILMFSVAIYKNISPDPIIFSDKIWTLAYQVQPNSLYISDDLSELNLSKMQTIWLFKHFDLLLYTNPKDININTALLQKAYDEGLITHNDIIQKINKQNVWRKNNNLVKLP